MSITGKSACGVNAPAGFRADRRGARGHAAMRSRGPLDTRPTPSSVLILPSSQTHARRLADVTAAWLVSVSALSPRYGFCPNVSLQSQEPGPGPQGAAA